MTNSHPDLDLAAACARGDAAALQQFEQRFAPVIDAAARRFGNPAFAADVGQLVRSRLFTTAQSKARIGEYAGRGPLEKFVQAVTVRVALNQLSANQRHAHVQGDEALLSLPGASNPELDAMKARYRDEFKAAFARAMGALEETSRSALRMHYLDGLTLSEIGALYEWSVPTACRRITAAREALLVSTRRIMADELKLTPVELDSVLRLIESRLSVEGLVPG